MLHWMRRFRVEEEGQDLIEYSLLICFIAIACIAFLGMGHGSVTGIWTTATTDVTSAQAAADGK